jgi:hypothetical protein
LPGPASLAEIRSAGNTGVNSITDDPAKSAESGLPQWRISVPPGVSQSHTGVLLATAPPEPEPDGSAADRVTALQVGTATRMAEQEQLARFVYTVPLRHEALVGDQAVRPGFIDAVAALLAEGVAAGELRDDVPAELMTGHVMRAFEAARRVWAVGRCGDPAAHVGRMVDLALHGCRARPG